MSQQIIKQPNGLYAIYSTISNQFIFFNASPEDIVNEWVNQYRAEAYQAVDKIVKQLENGEKPYNQFTMSFDEAVDWIKVIYGENCHNIKVLKELELI